MSYQISYSSVLFTKWSQNSLFTGSSKHRLIDGELLTIKRPKYEKKSKQIKKSEINETTECPIDEDEHAEPSKKENTVVVKKTYKLNKSKVRKKCHAFSRLEKSKKFLAFYSISFPNGLSDETGYRIYNTWLTRCRKDTGLKSYLWVAERQKNCTIHFHLLTNDFMQIRKVNGFMASCLTSEKENGNEILKDVNTAKYNGVDVKKVGNNRKFLIGYLTKYITKNDIEFTHLPWHCSRDVSKLFTTINFEMEERDRYFNQIPDNLDKYNIHLSENVRVGGFKFKPNDQIYNELDDVNELLYNEK